MSESNANLETLDNEDIYKQCLCFDETRFGPYTKHFEDGIHIFFIRKPFFT